MPRGSTVLSCDDQTPNDAELMADDKSVEVGRMLSDPDGYGRLLGARIARDAIREALSADGA